MKKLIKIIIGVVLILVCVVVIAVVFFLGPIIKTSIETAGPKVAGVPITLDKVAISVFSGRVHLKSLVVGNPAGFSSDHIFKLGNFSLNVDIPSVLSDKVVIHDIIIDGPEISYEPSLSGGNIAQLRKNLEGDKPSETAQEPAEPKDKTVDGGGKKIQIDHFVLRNGKVRLSSRLLRDQADYSLSLPTIELRDIGKDKGGASVSEIADAILTVVSKAVTVAAIDSGQFGKASKVLGDKVSQGMDVVKGTASKGVESAGDVTKEIGKSIGAEPVKAEDAAKKAGDNLEKEAAKTVESIKGLF